MEITSNSLQELIDKRAKDRAWEFVRILLEQCKNAGLHNVVGTYKNGDYERSFSDVFNMYANNDKNPFTLLYLAKIKQFTKEETESFVKKVEELHNQADTLLNIADNLNY